MVTRVSTSFDNPEGEGTTQEMPSTKNYRSSADIENTSGVEVRRGMGKASVADASELQDNDVVTIDGVEVKAGLAREMGLLGEVFKPVRSPEELDPNLSSGAAAQQQQQAQETETTTGTTGNEAYDTAAEGLNAALEAGTMEFAEAQSYDTVNAQMAMANINVDDAVDTLSELEAGTKSELDIGSENAAMLKDAQTKVTEAATQSAVAELGQESFDMIRQAAAVDGEVNEAVRNYAIMRATGRADGLTWSDFLEDVKAHIGR